MIPARAPKFSVCHCHSMKDNAILNRKSCYQLLSEGQSIISPDTNLMAFSKKWTFFLVHFFQHVFLVRCFWGLKLSKMSFCSGVQQPCDLAAEKLSCYCLTYFMEDFYHPYFEHLIEKGFFVVKAWILILINCEEISFRHGVPLVSETV